MAQKPRIQDIYDTLLQRIYAAVVAAGITNPGQAFPGLPLTTNLRTILAAKGAQSYVMSVHSRPGSATNTTCHPADDLFTVADPNVSLVATVDLLTVPNTITFSGIVTGGLNVHTFAGSQDAYVQTSKTDTLASIAENVAQAINDVADFGVSAVASTAGVVTVTGNVILICNVGGSGILGKEIAEMTETFQISIWTATSSAPPGAPDPTQVLRWNLQQAILEGVGAYDNAGNSVALADGTHMSVQLATMYLDDGAQADFGVYADHLAYRIAYPMIRYLGATEIGSLATIVSVDQTVSSSFRGG